MTTTTANKIAELTELHGSLFRKPFEAGQIRGRRIDELYGRGVPRQRAILLAMQSGRSYDAAYKESVGPFDTKSWLKVGNRTAAARGHLLKSAARIVSSGTVVSFSADEVQTLRDMTYELRDEAVVLSRRILSCELREATERRRQSRSSSDQPGPIRFTHLRQQLGMAISKLRKTSRDIPQMAEQLGELPTVRHAAHTLVEVARILRGVPLFIAAIDRNLTREGDHVAAVSGADPWGIGRDYSRSLAGLCVACRSMRRIATHRHPDADALVAAWIAERYLFPNDDCQIEFVARGLDADVELPYDCIVDVGRVHTPERRIFDHKPPAFANRNETCATKLIWQHVRDRQISIVNHLAGLVELVHDGDAATRRSRSDEYAVSRRTGLHALIRHSRNYCESDQMLYQAIKVYLDATESLQERLEARE